MKTVVSTVLTLALVLSAALVVTGPLSTPVAADAPPEVWVRATHGDDANPGTEAEPFETIQKGIDEVAEAGTVHVKAGDYHENVTISNKSLTLKSTEGADNTTIIGLVTIDIDAGQRVVFGGEEGAGFTIDRGNPVGESGILLSVENGSEVTISHNTITGTNAGIRSETRTIAGGSTVTIEHNVITGCPGAGIHLDLIEDSTVTIDSNEITGNRDGIYIDRIDQGPDTVTITGNTITGNTERGINVGVVIGSALMIEDNDVQDNGHQGIRIYRISTDSTVDIRDNTIGGDTVDDGNGGAGIYIGYIDDSSVTIGGDTEDDGNTISHNGRGVPTTGIHIDFITNSDAIIEYNTITDNGGPGIHIDMIGRAVMTVTIARNTITDNTLSGIRVRDVFESTLIIEENTIRHNGGLQDANVWINSIYDSEVTIEANTISDGRDGRGIRLDQIGHAPDTVSIIWNTITGTDLGVSLGDIFESSLNILGNAISDNDTGIWINQADDNSAIGINFNNIFDNAEWGLRNLSAIVVDATHNWWGAADGPSQSPGSGDRVSENVDFAPWLGAAITDQRTGCTTDRGYGVDAEAETANVSATSTGGNPDTTVTLAEYAGNPTDVDPGFVMNNVFFFDVHVGGPTPYPDQLVVEVICPGGNCAGVVLKWFNGTEWLNVTPRSIVGGKVRATLSDTSSPTIEQLTGSPFGLGNTPPQPPTAGSPYPIWTVLLAGLMAGVSLLLLRRRQTQS